MNKGTRVLTQFGMGTVKWTSDVATAGVTLDDGTVRVIDFYDLDELDYQADKDLTDTHEVWLALNFVHQLRQRGDEPGTQMADLLEPLASAYKKLKEGN